ncbi:MAG TPA: NADH-quinone oxidoreductase subunit C [Gemmataceae bacterium]|nr:NADH-quinone oxidoreductase subunit C [Gemmataceae bacterium]
MTSADIISRLERQFGPKIKSKKLDTQDPYVVVDGADLLDVCQFLHDDHELGFDILNCISGVDYFEPDPKKAPKAGFEPHLEVVYHLHSFRHHHRFVLKVNLPRWMDNKPGELPELPSVSDIWGAAEWHEREVYDLTGVWFNDHPDLRRILLAEDWAGYPLRKDYEFPLEYHGIRGR